MFQYWGLKDTHFLLIITICYIFYFESNFPNTGVHWPQVELRTDKKKSVDIPGWTRSDPKIHPWTPDPQSKVLEPHPKIPLGISVLCYGCATVAEADCVAILDNACNCSDRFFSGNKDLKLNIQTLYLKQQYACLRLHFSQHGGANAPETYRPNITSSKG